MIDNKKKPAVIEEGYAIAYSFYQAGKYVEAIQHFRHLLALDLKQAKIWTGLGASLQMLQQYQEAATAYAVAAFLNSANPQPHIYAAECFFALKDISQGLLTLEAAEKLTQGKEEYAALNERIQTMKKMWS